LILSKASFKPVRVLKPGGRLLLFEHVRSRNAILGLALDAMTLWTRIGGTEMNRDTIRNVLTAPWTENLKFVMI
jgi:hypothetical protein